MLAVIVFFRAWRIPPGIGPFWPVRSDVLIGSWIVMLLAGAAGGYITMLSLTESSPLRQQAMTMIVLYVIDFVIIGILLLIITRARRAVALAAEPTRRSTPLATGIAWGVLGFIVAFPIAQSFGIVIGIVQEYVGGWVPEVLAHDTLKAIQAAPGDPWAIVVMVLVVLVTPLVEEFAYRGLIQQGFRGLGADRFSAILLTSLLFVFMHVPALPYTSIAPAIATLLALSFFLGWLQERTGRLAAPIIAHALFNAANLAFFEFGF